MKYFIELIPVHGFVLPDDVLATGENPKDNGVEVGTARDWIV